MNGNRLEGLEVVEICNAIAGPFAGRLLAENGAHVTKVEPIFGEDYRNRDLWYDSEENDEFTYRFLEYNTGKDSVALDLKDSQATEILTELLDDADVFLENLRAGVIERLGFDWEAINAENSELIYCSITGYGEYGPYKEWPAYDPAVQGVGGWSDQIGVGGDDRPRILKVSAIDHSTALYACNGILMALVERNLTGEGQRVDVSMFDVAFSFHGHYLAERSATNQNAELEPRYDMHIIEPGGIFEVKDGYMTLVVMPEYWESFCKAIDREEYATPSHRFFANDDRLALADELQAELEEIFATETAPQWIRHFADHAPRTICSPVNRISDLFDDPHVEERELIEERNHPVMGSYSIPRTALRFSGGEIDTREPPRLGENTDEVLATIGYTSEEIERFREEGVVK